MTSTKDMTPVSTDPSQRPSPSSTRQPNAVGEHLLRNPESKALWTDGLPDPQEIKNRMEALATQFAQSRPKRTEPGQFFHQRFIWQQKAAEMAFYAEMAYYESLLHPEDPDAHYAPVTPAPPVTPPTPYVPWTPRRRGRPRTGIKPRDRRVKKDDDSY